jgi:hypothetical protein
MTCASFPRICIAALSGGMRPLHGTARGLRRGKEHLALRRAIMVTRRFRGFEVRAIGSLRVSSLSARSGEKQANGNRSACGGAAPASIITQGEENGPGHARSGSSDLRQMPECGPNRWTRSRFVRDVSLNFVRMTVPALLHAVGIAQERHSSDAQDGVESPGEACACPGPPSHHSASFGCNLQIAVLSAFGELGRAAVHHGQPMWAGQQQWLACSKRAHRRPEPSRADRADPSRAGPGPGVGRSCSRSMPRDRPASAVSAIVPASRIKAKVTPILPTVRYAPVRSGERSRSPGPSAAGWRHGAENPIWGRRERERGQEAAGSMAVGERVGPVSASRGIPGHSHANPCQPPGVPLAARRSPFNPGDGGDQVPALEPGL